MVAVNKLSNWILLNKDTLFKQFQTLFTEEDYNNESNIQYKIIQDFYSILLSLIIDFNYTNSTLTWNDIIVKYDLVKIKEDFKCCNINLEKLFLELNLPSIDIIEEEIENGINFIGIENCFIVDPDELCGVLNFNIFPNSTLTMYGKTINELIKIKKECNNLLNPTNVGILDENLLLVDDCVTYLKL